KDLTLTELTARVAELWADRHGRAPYLIELHKRFALPLAALVFALVAFPLAIRSHRGGRSVAFAGSLAILLTYYVVMTSLEGAAWWPSFSWSSTSCRRSIGTFESSRRSSTSRSTSRIACRRRCTTRSPRSCWSRRSSSI